MTSDPTDSNFSYKHYCLEQLDNWVNSALDCSDITAQEIYDTITNCSHENATYHKYNFDKNAEVLSLLKGYKENLSEATEEDWNDFWNSESEGREYPKENTHNFKKSKYYYEYDRNDPHRIDPFTNSNSNSIINGTI